MICTAILKSLLFVKCLYNNNDLFVKQSDTDGYTGRCYSCFYEYIMEYKGSCCGECHKKIDDDKYQLPSPQWQCLRCLQCHPQANVVQLKGTWHYC